MNIFNYSRETMEFVGQTEARVNPREKGKYLVPAYATTISPLKAKDGFAICFNKDVGQWEYKEDNRGKTIYSTEDRSEKLVDYIGKIKDGFTEKKPSIFSIWREDKWVIDTDTELLDAKAQKIKELSIDLYLVVDSDVFSTQRVDIQKYKEATDIAEGMGEDVFLNINAGKKSFTISDARAIITQLSEKAYLDYWIEQDWIALVNAKKTLDEVSALTAPQ